MHETVINYNKIKINTYQVSAPVMQAGAAIRAVVVVIVRGVVSGDNTHESIEWGIRFFTTTLKHWITSEGSTVQYLPFLWITLNEAY